MSEVAGSDEPRWKVTLQGHVARATFPQDLSWDEGGDGGIVIISETGDPIVAISATSQYAALAEDHPQIDSLEIITTGATPEAVEWLYQAAESVGHEVDKFNL